MPSTIVAPRVAIVDPRTGLISREWYNFFLNLFTLTGSGQSTTSITDLEIGPPEQPVVVHVDPAPSDGYLLAQLAEALKTFQALQDAPLVTGLLAQLTETLKALQGLQVAPSAVPLRVPTVVGVVTVTLDFPNTPAQTSSDLTITVPGAVVGDFVSLALPSGSILPNSCYTGNATAPDTVTVSFHNYSAAAQNPPAGDFTALVTRL